MLEAAKEEIFSVPMVWTGEGVLPLAADPASLEDHSTNERTSAATHFCTTTQLSENSRLGFARKNAAPHQGSAWSNSARALGIDGALLENRGGSRYTGKERDGESNLDYFGARSFSSQFGRFFSVDPLGLSVSGTGSPQLLNSYGYALNNPLFYIDPDGRDPQQFVANLAKAWQAVAGGFRKAGQAYDIAITKAGKVWTANPGFSLSHITWRDVNAIGATATLALITDGLGELPEAGPLMGATRTVALDTSVMIDIEKGATSASSLGGNLVVSPTAFNEFLAGTTPEKAAQFLKDNNIAIQGVGNAQVYGKVLEAGLKDGLSQNDAEILATAASNGSSLQTTDKALLAAAKKMGFTVKTGQTY